MGFLGQEFDVNAMPESQGFDPIPAGWYNAKIAAAELKDTKAGTGKYINVRYDILGPSYEGRVVFGMINVSNPSETAEEIGRQNLGDLMRAIGLAKVRDTDQLIGGTCQIKVAIRKSEDYGEQNQIKGWKSMDGGTLPMPAAPAQPTAPAQSGGAPPWASK